MLNLFTKQFYHICVIFSIACPKKNVNIMLILEDFCPIYCVECGVETPYFEKKVGFGRKKHITDFCVKIFN